MSLSSHYCPLITQNTPNLWLHAILLCYFAKAPIFCLYVTRATVLNSAAWSTNAHLYFNFLTFCVHFLNHCLIYKNLPIYSHKYHLCHFCYYTVLLFELVLQISFAYLHNMFFKLCFETIRFCI